MQHLADDPNHLIERNVFNENNEASLIGRAPMLLSTRLSSYTVGGGDQTDGVDVVARDEIEMRLVEHKHVVETFSVAATIADKWFPNDDEPDHRASVSALFGQCGRTRLQHHPFSPVNLTP